MNHHLIGEITLSISTIIYFVWFIPQIWLNFKRHDTEGLSMWMHAILLLGYSADLLYGFGRHMQWQYRMVTIVGLMWLCVQHFQFWRLGLHTRAEKINFSIISILVIFILNFAIMNFLFYHHNKQYYDVAGYVSNFCWLTYLIPQIIKNFKEKSTEGLSLWFIILSLLLNLLDLTSALMLKWDQPSVLNPFIGIGKKAIVLFQMRYYRNPKK